MFRLSNIRAFVGLLIAIIFLVETASCGYKKGPMPQGMRMKKIDYSKVNISQTEFAAKLKDYYRTMERNKQRRFRSGYVYEGENIGETRFYSFKPSEYKKSSHGRMKFTYNSDLPKNVYVRDANLRLLVVPTECGRQDLVMLKIRAMGRIVHQEPFNLGSCRAKWLGLNILNNFKLANNLSIDIECLVCEQHKLKVKESHLNLVLQKKNLVHLRRGSGRKLKFWPGRCTKREFGVDIGLLEGFSHIVAPKWIDLGLCAGKCSKLKHFPNQHTHLRFLSSLKNRTIPSGCCSASKLNSLEVLYYDYEKHELNKAVWNDTIAAECECR